MALENEGLLNRQLQWFRQQERLCRQVVPLPCSPQTFKQHSFMRRMLIDDLEQWDSISSLEAKVKPILASLACHGAVRAGRSMALPEIKQLVQDWVAEGLIMTCPHGRRVAFRLSADELARMFDRA